jgi:hypothetical protein
MTGRALADMIRTSSRTWIIWIWTIFLVLLSRLEVRQTLSTHKSSTVPQLQNDVPAILAPHRTERKTT